MSSRYLGVSSLQRYLVVERYVESHQASSTHPRRTLAVERDRRADPGAPAVGREARMSPVR